MDLRSSDTDRAREFYGQLFGWTAHETGPEFNDYVNFTLDGVLVAGMVAADPATDQPDAWTTYLAAAQRRAPPRGRSSRRAVRCRSARTRSADIGVMAVAVDPAGRPSGCGRT